MSYPTIALILVFALAVCLLFHAYAGYPLLVRFAGGWLLPRPPMRRRELGGTVLMIAVHNEEAVIGEKVQNAVRLEPQDMQIVVLSDGSTDRTDEIVQSIADLEPRVRLIRLPERGGKSHALNSGLWALRLAPPTMVVFTDANALFAEDAVMRLRENLEDGAACVVGRLIFTDAATGTARAEGLYWTYENWIKQAEGALGRLPFANGAILATTAAEVGELPLDVANDFWIPITVLGAGKPVTYESFAVAWEPAPQAPAEEFARKVRMGNRQMRGVLSVWGRLDVPTRFQLISHKVIRWFGIPLLGIAGLSASILWQVHPFFRVAVALAAAPFVLGVAGFAGRYLGTRLPVIDLAAHFLVVHWAAFLGVAEGLRGKRRAMWGQAVSSRTVKAVDPAPWKAPGRF